MGGEQATSTNGLVIPCRGRRRMFPKVSGCRPEYTIPKEMGRMTKRLSMVVLVAIWMGVLAGCASSDSADKTTLPSAEATAVGTELITNYWNTLSCDASDSVAYAGLLDPGFQSVLASGPMTKDDVLRALASTCISSTEVKDIVVTAAPDTLIVSYKARRTANGVQGNFNQLVNVFVKNGDDWDGVVSANAGAVPGQ
jgi:hypothetical protein